MKRPRGFTLTTSALISLTTLITLITLPITAAHGETVPDDGDSWSEYAVWPEAYSDGWVPECGLTLQTITPHTAADCMVGAGSVGFELQSGVWNKKFTYENPEWAGGGLPMDNLIALHFWYKTTWEVAVPRYSLRVYVEPTATEALEGVTAKRLSWQFPTALAWTAFEGSFEDAVWECYSGALWSPCLDTATPTAVLKLEWDYFEIFGPGAGNRTLIDGLHFELEPPTPVWEPDGALTVQLRNHPNPFQHVTTIRFEQREPTSAKLAIYDVRGRRVRALPFAAASGGAQLLRWDGRDDQGRLLPAGVYFPVVGDGAQSRARPIVLIR